MPQAWDLENWPWHATMAECDINKQHCDSLWSFTDSTWQRQWK